MGVTHIIKSTIDIVSMADSELGPYGSHTDKYPWHMDAQYITLEMTGVR